jgi:hypothetical protein
MVGIPKTVACTAELSTASMLFVLKNENHKAAPAILKVASARLNAQD